MTRNKKLSSSFHVISNDVSRTNRTHPAFLNNGCIGMSLLTTLLRTYCLYNFQIGYLQGMNDLFVPIIFAYYPNWNDEGKPIGEEGHILNTDEHISDIFWCYDSMIKSINHIELIADVQKQCVSKSKIVVETLSKVSPMIYIWLKHYDLTALLWVYQDFVLLYKRTWNNIWDLWLMFYSFVEPKDFLIYFIAATIIKIFPKLANIKETGITMMMTQFQLELEKEDPKEIGRIALWVANVAPLDECENEIVDNEKNDTNLKRDYRFFDLFKQ